VQALGCDGISKSQVSRICQALDTQVQAFRERPLDEGPYPYVWLDALTQKVREGGHVVNVAVVVATAVTGQGQREVLGLDCGASEDGAFWLSFLRGLKARGLSGVQLVVSDAHQGLKDAIAAVFAGAAWQRCRTHFARNLLTRVPKSAQPFVATLVRSIFDQPSAEDVRVQHARVVAQLEPRFPDAARMLADAAEEVLAFAAFPQQHWRKIRSNNPQERLNLEIRRRTNVVGIFPNRAAVLRLVGMVLAEQHDEWLVGRRYLADESLRLVTAHEAPSIPFQEKETTGQLPIAV
jgi:transposase-like protein